MTSKKEKISLEQVIDKLIKNISENRKYSYDDLKEKLQVFREELDDENCCILLEWVENNFWDKPKNNWTFWANFVDLIRNWFFFQTKNLMGSFAEEVIDIVADLERWKILWNIKEDLGGEEKIKEKIWDSFLRDNLLYFKKSDAEDRN